MTDASEMSDENLRIVLVGERAAGKTALARALLEEPFASDYTPTVLDDYRPSPSPNNLSFSFSFSNAHGHTQ